MEGRRNARKQSGFTVSLPWNPGTSEPARHLPDGSFLRSRWLFPEDQRKQHEPGRPCICPVHQISVPTLSPRPSCFCLSSRENMAHEHRFHRASTSAGCSWNAWLALSRASSFSYSSRYRAPANQPLNRPKLVRRSWNFITSYLGKIWNELGVSKGLVVPHVGIETSCIYQEGLKRTQRRRRVGWELLKPGERLRGCSPGTPQLSAQLLWQRAPAVQASAS